MDEVVDINARRVLEHVPSEHQRVERRRKAPAQLVVLLLVIGISGPQSLLRFRHRFVLDVSLLLKLTRKCNDIRRRRRSQKTSVVAAGHEALAARVL